MYVIQEVGWVERRGEVRSEERRGKERRVEVR
jgi:hypothetical protein